MPIDNIPAVAAAAMGAGASLSVQGGGEGSRVFQRPQPLRGNLKGLRALAGQGQVKAAGNGGGRKRRRQQATEDDAVILSHVVSPHIDTFRFSHLNAAVCRDPLPAAFGVTRSNSYDRGCC
jgi:hypothetical protein